MKLIVFMHYTEYYKNFFNNLYIKFNMFFYLET